MKHAEQLKLPGYLSLVLCSFLPPQGWLLPVFTIIPLDFRNITTYVCTHKVESEKVGLKLNIQNTKIMASGPITPWEIDGETMETVSDFIFGAPKSLQMVIAAMKLKDSYSLEGKLWPT